MRFPSAAFFRIILIRFIGIGFLWLAGAPQFVHGTQVTLAWDERTNPEPDYAGTRVYWRKLSASVDFSQVAEVGPSETSATVTGLENGETYCFTITAFNTFGLESEFSNIVEYTVPVSSIPPDTDNDGLPDHFEATHGDGGDLDPNSDLDGDGLTALAEYVHGLDPTAPLTGSPLTLGLGQEGETSYLQVTYFINAEAVNFVVPILERRVDLADSVGWLEGQTIHVSTTPITTPEGVELLEVVERSVDPLGTYRMEFFRFRYDRVSSGESGADKASAIPEEEADRAPSRRGRGLLTPLPWSK